MTRNVKSFSVTRDGELVTMKVEADGFLYNMVRIMVGTLLAINEGKLEPEAISEILESGDRSRAGKTARPEGLYLDYVYYDEDSD